MDFRSNLSRRHVSSEVSRFWSRYRPSRCDIDQFGPSFKLIFKSLKTSTEEIEKHKLLLTALRRLINEKWPNSKLQCYGSCAYSFALPDSDIDLSLSIDDTEISKDKEVILELQDILSVGDIQIIEVLPKSRVPILKLKHPETDLSCDISVNNSLAVVNTQLLKDYTQIDERLGQLASIVKYWAKCRRVNSRTYRGTLSSYAYVIMCIHHLQLRRILPCLQEMEATYSITVDKFECAYFNKVSQLSNYGTHNTDTVSRLLLTFFRYWAYDHDYTSDVISIRTGRIISKESKDWTRSVGDDRHLICIEDPFEISHDVGRAVNEGTINILRMEFERAADILEFDPNPCIALFEPYMPSPDPREVGRH